MTGERRSRDEWSVPGHEPDPDDPSAPVGSVEGVSVTATARRTSWRGDLRAGATTIVALAAAGALVGVLWYAVAPRAKGRVNDSGQALLIGPPDSDVFFAGDGWFVVLTVTIGLAAALVSWWWRAPRGPLQVLALAVGGLVGALSTWGVGHLLGGRGDITALVANADVGDIVTAPLRLRSSVALVVEPLIAVAVYVICVGFAARDDLRRE